MRYSFHESPHEQRDLYFRASPHRNCSRICRILPAGLCDPGFVLVGNYTPVLGALLTDTQTIILIVVGFSLIGFARHFASLAGATAAQMLSIAVCGSIGLGIWAAVFFHPHELFPRPLSDSLDLTALVLGWLGLAAASTCVHLLAGKPVPKD
jgi:hypothetical protein